MADATELNKVLEAARKRVVRAFPSKEAGDGERIDFGLVWMRPDFQRRVKAQQIFAWAFAPIRWARAASENASRRREARLTIHEVARGAGIERRGAYTFTRWCRDVVRYERALAQATAMENAACSDVAIVALVGLYGNVLVAQRGGSKE